ncbi:T9SS type A sorting domain-containing protein, partial [bacterium]|nr:T9SS type A sorting domain-containing protein [bacterium]
IPDGTPVNVYKGATLLGSPIMNGGGMGMGCGFFMLNYVAGVPGSDWWVEVVYGGCTYTSRMFTTVDGPQSIAIVQGDWTCDCLVPPTCTWIEYKGFACLNFEGPGEENGIQICWCCPFGIEPWMYANLYWTPGCANECQDPECIPYNGAVFGIDYASQSVVMDDTACVPQLGYWTTFVYTDGPGCICLYFQSQLPVALTADPILQIGDRQLTLKFNVSDELNVQHYEIMRDGDKVAELEVADGSYSYVDQNLVNGRRYEYSVVAVGLEETSELSFGENSVWAATPSFKAAVVTEYALHQNYPNPFNPSTEIVYDVLDLTHVTLKVYNVMGQEVSTLVNREMTTGRYAVTFDASGLTSGIYFYTVTMGDFTATKKMLLVQ